MIYTFDTGGGIRMHSHPVESNTGHNIIVLQGSICAYGENATWVKILQHGDIFDDFDPYEPHEVHGLQDGCKLLNLYWNKPYGFENNPKFETIDLELKYKIEDYNNPVPVLNK